MPRLWYPVREDVEGLAYELARELFDDYDSSLPGFALLGGERGGGGLLESALALPRQTYGGRALYPRIHHKAGVLLRSFIKNHPLVDGNKRMAMATTTLFLLMNGYLLLPPAGDMVRFALELAGRKPTMPWEEAADWVRTHAVNLRGTDDPREAIRQRFEGSDRALAGLMERIGEIVDLTRRQRGR